MLSFLSLNPEAHFTAKLVLLHDVRVKIIENSVVTKGWILVFKGNTKILCESPRKNYLTKKILKQHPNIPPNNSLDISPGKNSSWKFFPKQTA